MFLQLSGAVWGPIRAVFEEFAAEVLSALPRVVAGFLFLGIAWVGITVALRALRGGLERAYPNEQVMVVDLGVVIAGALLWFGAVLVLLKVLGMGEIAASLGTATGFVALGVAFAMKEMIADTVAGVYLLRDPDFNIGDQVETASVSGSIERIDLRKTRIRTESGDRVVVSNRDVEKRWTQHQEGSSAD